MKTAGKVHWMTVAGIAGIVLVIGIFMMGGESPQFKASEFMTALGKGDVQTLAKTTYVKGWEEAKLAEEWQRTIDRGQYYRFIWKITSAVDQGPDQVAVRMSIARNPGASSYDENFQLIVKKIDGHWKVLGNSLSREMYPYLPRF